MCSSSPWSAAIAALVAIAALPGATPAQVLTTQHVATLNAFHTAVFATHAPGDFGRLFIVEQGGQIDILQLPSNTLLPTPFLSNIRNFAGGSESGLLGLALDPDYQHNGYFYVYVTLSGAPYGNGSRVVQRYRRSDANPYLADPTSAQVVIRVDYLVGNHNAGWIGFGPDGYLYIAIGDSGVENNSQTLTGNLMGKILRLDVSGDDFPADLNRNYRIPPDNPFVSGGGDPEIWAYGLRNPFRCCFDSLTGALYIGDVGESDWEEIDYQPLGAAGVVGGRNYGWSCYEASRPNVPLSPTCPPLADTTLPLLAFPHFQQAPVLGFRGCAVIGGEVYRGCAMPGFQGTYFFGDHCGNAIFSLRTDGAAITDPQVWTGQLPVSNLNSFGTDAYGEVYYCADGGVYKIIPAPGYAAPDCNNNGRPDPCDILARARAGRQPRQQRRRPPGRVRVPDGLEPRHALQPRRYRRIRERLVHRPAVGHTRRGLRPQPAGRAGRSGRVCHGVVRRGRRGRVLAGIDAAAPSIP